MTFGRGRPDPAALAALAVAARSAQPTSPTGLLNRPAPPGYQRDEWTTDLPHGFDAARDGLQHWAGHRAAGITIGEPAPELAVGETVAFSIPIGPISITAACRIVEIVDQPDCYGFVYATLPHHPEDGEESFIIRRDAHGAVTFSITAVSRPAGFATRVARPLARVLQRRTAGRYLDGVARWHPDRSETDAD